MTDKTLSEILEWLYVNDREFNSGKEWKEAFIKMLESKRKIEVDKFSIEGVHKNFTEREVDELCNAVLLKEL